MEMPEGNSTVPSDPPRIHSLDSLRGIAAFTVVLNHVWQVTPDRIKGLHISGLKVSALIMNPPLDILIGGRPAVMLFFVLSGFVLALQWTRGKLTYYQFVVRRFCRIYVPFVFSVAFAFALYQLTSPKAISLLGIPNVWSVKPTFSVLLSHVLMTGTTASHELNPPLWSLAPELRISLIFPLLVLLAAKAGHVRSLIGSVTVLVALYLLLRLFPDETIERSLLLSVAYIYYFVIGVVLASLYSRGDIFRLALSPAQSYCLLIVGILFMSVKWYSLSVTGADILYGIGSGLIILLTLRLANVQRILMTPCLAWLGRISYSLYLLHDPILLFCVCTLHNYLSFPEWLLVFFAAALFVSHLSYKYVECPSIALGRYLACSSFRFRFQS